jgi:formylglycine-generating enzyme required for sulfatase activity
MLQSAVIVRLRTSASAGVIFLVAGIATACAVACSHDLDEFTSGKPDTAVPPGDSIVTNDTADGGSGEDVQTDSAEDLGVDTGLPEDSSDTGPPPPEAGCTLAGPAGATCIPGATFDMGAVNTSVCPPSGCAAEMPKVSVSVSSFHLDDHEVSVARFRAWWNLSPIPWPAPNTVVYKSASKEIRWKSTWPSGPTAPSSTGGGCFWKGAADSTNDDKPINCVDYFTALGFCMWDGGKRLPTEAEFELAASGGQNRQYPWSAPETEDNPLELVTCANAMNINAGPCSPATAASESTTWGRARFGTWNLAGSVAEWALDGPFDYASIIAGTVDPVTDPGTTTTIPRQVRGGGYQYPLADLRAASRKTGVSSGTQDAQIGFRCAKR